MWCFIPVSYTHLDVYKRQLVFYIFFAPQLAFMMERLMYAVNAQMEAAEAVNKLEAILKLSLIHILQAGTVWRCTAA